MAYNDFWEMTPREYDCACDGYRLKDERLFKERWEQTRWLASYVVNSSEKSDGKVKPTSLLKFPWEGEGGEGIEKTDIDIINERREWRTGH